MPNCDEVLIAVMTTYYMYIYYKGHIDRLEVFNQSNIGKIIERLLQFVRTFLSKINLSIRFFRSFTYQPLALYIWMTFNSLTCKL